VAIIVHQLVVLQEQSSPAFKDHLILYAVNGICIFHSIIV